MRKDVVQWVNAIYRSFVHKMIDVLPDFPNCCYQISGGAASLLIDGYLLKNVRVTYGSYKQFDVYLPHGWVKATTRSGEDVIIDFAHLQFEPAYLEEGCGSYNMVVRSHLEKGDIPGKVIFFPDDPEYAMYAEDN